MEDANFLFKLKNNLTMRRWAVKTHARILKRDHMIWLKGNIHTIQIVEDGGVPLGMLRVTDDKEVSINLAPEARGRGVGTMVLDNWCPKGVWAKIVDGNVPSMRVFLKTGFEIVDHEKNYYILKN